MREVLRSAGQVEEGGQRRKNRMPADAPGVFERIMKLASDNPNVVVLRGNHEQMMLDCLDYGDLQWLIPENGGLRPAVFFSCTRCRLRPKLGRPARGSSAAGCRARE